MKPSKLTKMAVAVSSCLALTACDEDSIRDALFPKGELRVIHASPDAPPVNILLNGDEAIADLDYAQSTGFTKLKPGSYDIQVEGIIPGGNATVIDVPGFEITKESSPTVIAVNTVSSIEPIVVEESASTPEDNQVALVVAHAAPVAGAVDVYLTAPGDDISGYSPAFSFDYKGSVDAGALDAGEVEIQVAIGSTVVYNSGAVDLTAFAGQSIMIVALNSENETENSAAPIKLLVVTDEMGLELKDADTTAAARVVHASPDAAAAAGGAVEVFATSAALGADPVELIDGFDYTDVVPATDSYAQVPQGAYTFDVAPDTDMIGDSVFTSDAVHLMAGDEYTVIALGRVLGSPGFSLLPAEDDNRAIATQGSVKLTHAAPAAGDVDVYVTAGGEYTTADIEAGMVSEPLIAGFAFGDATDYVAIAPGSYDIRVVAGGSVAINVEGLDVMGGDVLHAIARGPSEPSGSIADFGVILLSK